MELNFHIDEMLKDYTADDIVAAFTQDLNEALAKSKYEQRKHDDCVNIADAWNDLVDIWIEENGAPAGFELEDLELTPDILRDIFDGFMNIVDKMDPVFSALDALAERDTCDCNKNDFDSIMRKFLNTL